MISKRRDSFYSGTRNPDWLKVKCINAEEFVIIGYTEPQRSRVGFGALLVGYYTPSGELTYAGKVGTGYSREFLESLRAKLERIEQGKPTAALPKGTYMRARVHWVKPRYVAQVEFTEWTRDNILRHPSFLGLREDKDSREVVVGRPARAAHDDAAVLLTGGRRHPEHSLADFQAMLAINPLDRENTLSL